MTAPVLPTRAGRPDLWDAERVIRRHVPQPRNPRRANGGFVLPSQGGGGGGFIVRNGVYVPLQYTDPKSPLQGGYGWCDRTDNGLTYHPG